MPDINNTAGLVRWKSEMVCEMIISGDKNRLELTCQFEYFFFGVPGGCRFRNSDYFVSFMT